MTPWNLLSLEIAKNPHAFIEKLKEKIEQFQKEQDTKLAFDMHQSIEAEVREIESYVGCLIAQNVEDIQVKKLQSSFSHLLAIYQTAVTLFDQKIANGVNISTFDKESQFLLEEKKELVKKKLSINEEKLIHLLSVDGFKSWEELYQNTVGSLKFELKWRNNDRVYSTAQMYNFLHHPDRNFRAQAFTVWEETFQNNKDLFAKILNSIAGFRLTALRLRGRSDFLEEPLYRNRMKRQTLEAMWNAVDAKKEVLTKFLHQKAKKMGLSSLNWHDVEVSSVVQPKPFCYDEAQGLIIKKFAAFSPRMGDYAKKAFAEKTIDAEDRASKMPGGFCTPFPLSCQSRIFMTWSGTRENLLTLAHELGHGFHSELLFDRTPLAQKYPMNLAETASTFAEQLIFDELIKEDKESVREEKALRSVLFLMNIRARFLFESEFYERRAKEVVSADELSNMMIRAQKHAFGNSLEFYHPHFWASKQHFYITDLPFYNFPYTFGYLFSLGLFAMANESNFGEHYCNLLKDTGSMTSEDLAMKHLSLDLTRPNFWEKAVHEATKDISVMAE